MYKKVIAIITLTIGIAIMSGYQEDHRFERLPNGTPVHLISATGPIDENSTKQESLQPFTHLSIHNNNLQIVARTYFYDSAEMVTPYLTIDAQHQGTLHIGVHQSFKIMTTKCEFLRQFVVEIPAEKWKGLTTLALYNHNTQDAIGTPIQITNNIEMEKLFLESRQNVALEEVGNTMHGC